MKREHGNLRRGFLPAVLLIASSALAGPDRWVQDSFEDFSAGRLDSADNLYVSRDGAVRTIHRYDFNQDGFLDLVFNSTHDVATAVPGTLGSIAPDRALREQEIAAPGSDRVVAGDLNRDGYADLVFLRNAGGIQNGRAMSIIVYGGADGWPACRAGGALPQPDAAADIALPDLNGDGWPEVVIVGGGKAPEMYVYWGSEEGFSTSRRSDLAAPPGARAVAADFDGDGFADMVIAAPGKLWTYWSATGKKDLSAATSEGPGEAPRFAAAANVAGSAPADLVLAGPTAISIIASEPQRSWAAPVQIPVAATHVACGDLDGDGVADLVATSFSQGRAAGGEAGAAREEANSATVLWGDASGAYGIQRSLRLPVKNATATAIADLDGDGHADLAAAVYQGEKTFKGRSPVLWGQGDRQFAAPEGGFTTQAPLDLAVVAGADHKPNLVFANSQGGTLDEKVPLDVYWGGKDGFSADRHWQVPFASGYESTAADLNADGYVDLLFTCSGHGGQTSAVNDQVGTHIFWGSAEGFKPDRRTVLREDKIWSLNVADLNRDGFLDIIACAESGVGGKPACLFIYWGSRDGFSTDRKTAIPMGKRALAGVAADLNNDGWLDLVSTDYNLDKVTILWGSAEGYSQDRSQGLEVDRALAVEVADWNGDGRLDLAVGRYGDASLQRSDMGIFVFWGSEKGFNHANAQWLPGLTPVDLTAADFDGDGYLDLFASDYHAMGMRESIPSYLFWGGKDGLRPERKARISADSASSALAGDFDRDGKLDLAISCHTQHGDHHTNSLVIYNDGKRFEQVQRIQKLPTAGTHWMDMHDMGHIRDRKWRQTYESPIHRWSEPLTKGQLTVAAQAPEGTSLRIEVRTAATPEALAGAPWRPLADREFTAAPTDRCMQYRAQFISDNGDRYPALESVRVDLAG